MVVGARSLLDTRIADRTKGRCLDTPARGVARHLEPVRHLTEREPPLPGVLLVNLALRAGCAPEPAK